jgi:hypothetical protein
MTNNAPALLTGSRLLHHDDRGTCQIGTGASDLASDVSCSADGVRSGVQAARRRVPSTPPVVVVPSTCSAPVRAVSATARLCARSQSSPLRRRRAPRRRGRPRAAERSRSGRMASHQCPFTSGDPSRGTADDRGRSTRSHGSPLASRRLVQETRHDHLPRPLPDPAADLALVGGEGASLARCGPRRTRRPGRCGGARRRQALLGFPVDGPGDRVPALARHRPEDVSLAVVVQRMVPADAAGVLFTADPSPRTALTTKRSPAPDSAGASRPSRDRPGDG